MNQVSNLINEFGSPEQIKGTEFLTELASIQAFEAIMYRDLNYVLDKIDEPKSNLFQKDLITGFLIESVLSKDPCTNKSSQSLKAEFAKY